MIIQNRKALLSHGSRKGRKIALDIIDATMEAIDASGLTQRLIRVEGNFLKISNTKYDLAKIRNIYVLGAGKAVLQIAEALEILLGDRIKKGIVIEKRLNGMTRGVERIKKLKRIESIEGGHPVPDEEALIGTQKMLEIAEEAGEGDLVFFCVQGGCTSLTTLPAEGLCLNDVKQTTDLLLQSGLEIKTVNAVRAAITRLSWGRFAKYIHPAEIINLVVNDYVWYYPKDFSNDPYNLGWGPTVPVSDSKQEELEAALLQLKGSRLWKKIPKRVRYRLDHLESEQIPMTAKDFKRMEIKYRTFVLAGPQDAVGAAQKVTARMGFRSLILSSMIEGESSEVGVVLAGIAKEISKNKRPLAPPCVIITAGEKTVTLIGKHGEGGRNQESVVSAALKIAGGKEVVILSVGTDGTDGPSYIAGGIVDGLTVERAGKKGIHLLEHLRMHNSSHVLTELGDAIYFNEPGNNVCDLSLIVVTG